MVHAGEEAVAVGGEVDADDFGGFVGDYVEEARVLVREAVVVLSPDDGGEEDVEGGDLVAPLYLEALLEPFAVLGRLAKGLTMRKGRGGPTWLTIESITWMNGS